MKKLSMVFSATQMIYLCPSSWMDGRPDLVALYDECVTRIVERMKALAEKELHGHFGSEMGCLYNGYTEPSMGEFYKNGNKYGFDKIYADSGGLQVVTLGKEMNRELMHGVYDGQAAADFGMSFDEIPAKNNNLAASRGDITARVFYPDLLKEKAILSGKNIAEQCQYFEDNGIDTKAFIITQGNRYQETVDWYDIIREQISDHHFENHIAGTALSFACIGTGLQESVENMIAYNIINEKHGLKNDRIHLLGYGAASRILPSIMLMDTKLLDDKVLSFDSTSLSLGYMMGRFLDPDTYRATDVGKPHQAKIYFSRFFEQVKDIYHDVYGDFDDDEFLTYLSDRIRSKADTVNLKDNKDINAIMSRAFVATVSLWQVIYLYKAITRSIEEVDPIYAPLREIEKVDDLVHWFEENRKYMKSKRVNRHIDGLDSFFL